MKPSTNAPAAVIFDFDGTLVDSMEAFADIAAGAMERHLGIDAATGRRRYLETSGIPFFQQLELIAPGNPKNAAASEEFERLKLENYFNEPLYHDTAETLRHLRAQGVKVVVSSNNFQHLVDQFVEHKGIAFDLVLGFQEGFDKGEAHFRQVEKTLGIPRERMAFVGDSLKDGERATASGVAFIGKEGTFSRREFRAEFPKARVIQNLGELKALFGKGRR